LSIPNVKACPKKIWFRQISLHVTYTSLTTLTQSLRYYISDV